MGEKKWRRNVKEVVARLIVALEPDYVVLGGGNVHKLKKMPPNCRAGANANAFRGGVRLWQEAGERSDAATPSFRWQQKRKQVPQGVQT
jgi:polyphosphate glucokinase